jgi:hypothetical protein
VGNLKACGIELEDQRLPQPLVVFAAAARSDPANARYTYVYAAALNDSGQTNTTMGTLKRNISVHPYDRESLAALVSFCDQARANPTSR